MPNPAAFLAGRTVTTVKVLRLPEDLVLVAD